MNWIITKLQAIEWLYTLKPINVLWGFPLITFIVTSLSISPFYYLTDICFKSKLCPEGSEEYLLLSSFLSIWLLVMALSVVILLTLGSHILRYVMLSSRVDDLKTSGLVNKTKHSISLIGLSLHPFANQEWRDVMEEKLKSGVEIRFLIVDPETEFARNRHSSLGNKKDHLSDDIKKSIVEFTNHNSYFLDRLGRGGDNFEVRLYKNNACMSTFIFDDEIRLGLLLENGTGLNAPEIRVSNRGKQVDIFKKIKDHFDKVWEEAEAMSPIEGSHEQ